MLALLDHLVLGCDMLDLHADNVADHQIAALEWARLLRVNDLDCTVHLFAEPSHRGQGAPRVCAAIRRLSPGGLGGAGPEDVHIRADGPQNRDGGAARGPWRRMARRALGDRGTKALGLARNDTSVSTSSLDAMYRPLDWFLLEDLLDFAAEVATSHGKVRGVGASEWARLKVQMVPIRSRVAHMRLPMETDAAAVRSALLNLDARIRVFESGAAGM